MRKLETVQSHVYTLMDKLRPVKEAMTQKDDDWEEWDFGIVGRKFEEICRQTPIASGEYFYRRLVMFTGSNT